ncbi:AzlD domain-containing protein [Mesorhizobium sp. VNQ89]|uniref:AzlD domain-containing protein n=1 Tax=Mesorhizobium quangtriensis TaxID=3157709 RepID=UPI0032B724A6
MTIGSIDAWWWPYAFVLIAGWAMTYPWRAFGVFLGGRLRDDAEILVLVRSIATALVAAVVGNLICFPAGPAADTTLALRLAAALAGFAAYFFIGRKILIGIIVAEAVFGLGFYLGY